LALLCLTGLTLWGRVLLGFATCTQHSASSFISVSSQLAPRPSPRPPGPLFGPAAPRPLGPTSKPGARPLVWPLGPAPRPRVIGPSLPPPKPPGPLFGPAAPRPLGPNSEPFARPPGPLFGPSAP
ncbi:unnamed protein product, partial [Closterium sp. NIES-53]